MNLSHYSIIEKIGEGGMASVYSAEDKKFDTTVAIKLLNKELCGNENIRKRFLAEAKSLYKMSHANIVKVTDLIEDADTVAFVMEYIDGETLKQYIEKRGKLANEEIKDLFFQMLDAVGYVHDQQLIHRDIKPSNFMVDRQGRVKLMDFGIAKSLDTTSPEYTITHTSQKMGTPMYMSPEQVKSSKDVTLKTDVYSLGVVLWQMVSGKRPYDSGTLSNFEIQLKIFQEQLPLLNSPWDAVIQKATAKNELDRFKDSKTIKLFVTDSKDVSNQGSTSKSDYVDDIKNDPIKDESTIVEDVNLSVSIKIGIQRWMKKNLDVSTYRNGDIIPQVTDKNLWANLTTGAWCYYDNDPKNGVIYGKLYNWYAVNDPRGLAPSGWHIPTDAEWTILSNTLGGESVAGGKMKATETTLWSSPNRYATNESGFSGLPGGIRNFNGRFFNVGNYGNWWSASQDYSSYAWSRNLYYFNGNLFRVNFNKRYGFSVRCLRD